MAKNETGRGPDLGERLHSRKNKYAAPVGGVFLALMAIGLISVAIFCVDFTRNMLDNSGEKEEFGKIIAPVLMFDPIPFENAADADPLFLLQSSMWSALLGEKRDSYQYDNETNLRLIVPASDIDVACARLFGPEVELHHQTFGDYETTYVYDEESKTYYIPTTMEAGPSPNVLSVVKKGDTYTLEVEYVPPATAWTQAGGMPAGANGLTQNKRMIYELKRIRDHFQLMAIRDVPRDLSSTVEISSSEEEGASAQSEAS